MTSTKPQPPIYLLDGGLGTTLEDSFKYTFDDSTPLWSSQLLITDPSKLLKAHTAFADAGADIILSATYQASFEGFARSGVNEEDAGRLMRSAVQLARKSFRHRRGQVALSLGAYGATMIPSQEYSGAYDEDHVTRKALRNWHSKRLEAFLPDHRGKAGERQCWGDIDYVAFETLPRLDEVRAVRSAMASVGKEVGEEQQKPFWISCVFPGEHSLLPDGSSVREVVEAMVEKGEGEATPMGIGINCTKVGKVDAVILEFEDAIYKLIETGVVDGWPSLVVYPDGTNGEVYNTVTKEWEKGMESMGSEESWHNIFFEIVSRARQRGLWQAIYIGGCCKTGPDDIAKLRDRIDR